MKPTVAQQIGMKEHQFERLFAKYQRVVFCGAYSVTGNTPEAEDRGRSPGQHYVSRAD